MVHRRDDDLSSPRRDLSDVGAHLMEKVGQDHGNDRHRVSFSRQARLDSDQSACRRRRKQ